MVRYFFDIEDGDNLPDHTGTELPHVDAAREHALRIVETYLQEPGHAAIQPVRVTIRDQTGRELDSLVGGESQAGIVEPDT